MTLNRELTDFERGRVIGQWDCGKNAREIAEALGFSQSQVTRAINGFRDSQKTTVQPRSGRPRSMSDRNVRYLAQEVRKNRQITADELAQHMDESLAISVTERTIRSYFYEAGFTVVLEKGNRSFLRIIVENGFNGVRSEKRGLMNGKL